MTRSNVKTDLQPDSRYFAGDGEDGPVKIYGRVIAHPSTWVVRNVVSGDRYTGKVNVYTASSPKMLWLQLRVKNGEVRDWV